MNAFICIYQRLRLKTKKAHRPFHQAIRPLLRSKIMDTFFPTDIHWFFLFCGCFNPAQKKINENFCPLLCKRRSALRAPRGFNRDGAKTVGALFGGWFCGECRLLPF